MLCPAGSVGQQEEGKGIAGGILAEARTLVGGMVSIGSRIA